MGAHLCVLWSWLVHPILRSRTEHLASSTPNLHDFMQGLNGHLTPVLTFFQSLMRAGSLTSSTATKRRAKMLFIVSPPFWRMGSMKVKITPIHPSKEKYRRIGSFPCFLLAAPRAPGRPKRLGCCSFFTEWSILGIYFYVHCSNSSHGPQW